jgi:hypothetical protein
LGRSIDQPSRPAQCAGRIEETIMRMEQVLYALAKQVPAMRNEVTLRTSYGDILLYEEDAERVAKLVQRIMETRLRRLQVQAKNAAQSAGTT